KKEDYKRKFRPQWLDIKNFKSWLCEGPDNTSHCLICDKFIDSSLHHIYRHAESDMHKTKSEKSNINVNKSNEDLNAQSDESLSTFDERKKITEIKYAALITEKNILQTAKEILSLFQDIGKDPNVLKSMNMGRTKCKNIISNVLCSVETERVVNNIQNTRFSIFIDEISDITNEKWMTFFIRYI
ncbi:hypothetical protein EAG_14359, partial [Camponotus floridanus]